MLVALIVTACALVFGAIPLLIAATLRIRGLEGEVEYLNSEADELEEELDGLLAEQKTIADGLATLYHSIEGETP